MNVQHMCRSDRWYTPLDILNRVRRVLGVIDLDPASEEGANVRVKANTFYTEEDNGLLKPWEHGIFVNPPGGKTGNKSNTVLFWQKLMKTLADNKLDHAIFMAFSIEALATTQKPGFPSLGEFPICIPKKRIAFDKPEGFLDNKAPSHANAIAYVPGKINKTEAFVKEFSNLGVVLNVKED